MEASFLLHIGFAAVMGTAILTMISCAVCDAVGITFRGGALDPMELFMITAFLAIALNVLLLLLLLLVSTSASVIGAVVVAVVFFAAIGILFPPALLLAVPVMLPLFVLLTLG